MLEPLLSVQPRGPFYLEGYSFGGLLAYELAGLLRAQGHDVAFLALVDTPVPAEWLRQTTLWAKARWELRRGPLSAAKKATAMARRHSRSALSRIGFEPAEPGWFDSDGSKALFSRYHARPHDVPLVVFTATESLERFGSVALGWEKVHDGDVETVILSGDHFTIVSGPSVEKLARALLSDRMSAASASKERRSGYGFALTLSQPMLRPGETHVWRMRLPADGIDASDAWAMLGADERHAASRQARPEDRYAAVQARAALRRTLGRLLGCGPADVPLGTTADGKPVLISPLENAGTSFSVSHSGAIILIAIGAGLNVGVDVEEMRDSFTWEPVRVTGNDARRTSSDRTAPSGGTAISVLRLLGAQRGVPERFGHRSETRSGRAPRCRSARPGCGGRSVGSRHGRVAWTVRSLHPERGFAAAVRAPGRVRGRHPLGRADARPN